MSFAKNILIAFFFLSFGIAAQAQTGTTLPKTDDTTVAVKNYEVKKENKSVVLAAASTDQEEAVAFSFNHKQYMKPIIRKSVLC